MTHDWKLTPSFKPSEFACKCGQCGGEQRMDTEFMMLLQAMRDRVGPMVVTSGYRCALHPIEKAKKEPGTHARGLAADIRCTASFTRFKLIEAATACGMRGIGWADTFLHFDLYAGRPAAPRPAAWGYK
jgi:uncharacterized protein YcbK (DUF882 family)